MIMMEICKRPTYQKYFKTIQGVFKSKNSDNMLPQNKIKQDTRPLCVTFSLLYIN